MASQHTAVSSSRHENIFLWKPEFAKPRTIAYRAQDTPVLPRDTFESLDDIVEDFLTFNKARLEPTNMQALKTFSSRQAEVVGPPILPYRSPTSITSF
jgi:hypothetical protein